MTLRRRFWILLWTELIGIVAGGATVIATQSTAMVIVLVLYVFGMGRILAKLSCPRCGQTVLSTYEKSGRTRIHFFRVTPPDECSKCGLAFSSHELCDTEHEPSQGRTGHQ